jgi:hypothetical protein
MTPSLASRGDGRKTEACADHHPTRPATTTYTGQERELDAEWPPDSHLFRHIIRNSPNDPTCGNPQAQAPRTQIDRSHTKNPDRTTQNITSRDSRRSFISEGRTRYKKENREGERWRPVFSQNSQELGTIRMRLRARPHLDIAIRETRPCRRNLSRLRFR